MVESFWVIPDVANIRTPLSILREQAAALTQQTKGTLVGVVETSICGEDELALTLTISVPSLNDYRFHLLTYFQPVHLYPGHFEDSSETATDEIAFIKIVKATLSSTRVQNVLASLLSQAVDA